MHLLPVAHLRALVRGERAAQRVGQRLDLAGGRCDVLGLWPSGRGTSMAEALKRSTSVPIAGVSILFPPLALFVVAALGRLRGGGRRRSGEKCAGFRGVPPGRGGPPLR